MPMSEKPKSEQAPETAAAARPNTHPPAVEADEPNGALPESGDESRSLVSGLLHLSGDIAGGMASGAARLVTRTAGTTMRVGRAMLKPERLEMMRDTGLYLRDVREVAGLTLMEISEALDMEDKSLLEAVEAGTATLSFEFILRLAALVARHDPVPFVMRMTRTYNPSIWKILNDWGISRIPLQYERERQFINVLRRHDAARKLSDKGFEEVLTFTRTAFDMAFHFVAEKEGLKDSVREPKVNG